MLSYACALCQVKTHSGTQSTKASIDCTAGPLLYRLQRAPKTAQTETITPRLARYWNLSATYECAIKLNSTRPRVGDSVTTKNQAPAAAPRPISRQNTLKSPSPATTDAGHAY